MSRIIYSEGSPRQYAYLHKLHGYIAPAGITYPTHRYVGRVYVMTGNPMYTAEDNGTAIVKSVSRHIGKRFINGFHRTPNPHT